MHLFNKPSHFLQAANGSTINAYGYKLLKVSLGLRRDFACSFCVAQVTKPIIGADFLDKFGLLVDIRNKQLIDPNVPSLKFFEVNSDYT